jgi:signal transduction histidine kinase
VEVARESSGRVVLDSGGNYREFDQTALTLLGPIEPGSPSFVRIPAEAEEVWWLERRPEVTPVPLVCCLVPAAPDDQWLLSVTSAPDGTQLSDHVRRYAERAVAEVATQDLDTMVHALTGAIQALCGFNGCLVVLIDERTGEALFAGGEGMDREHLAALQENRRRGAPMVIWQAFEENRVVVKRDWVRHVREDPRLEPIRAFIEQQPDPGMTFLAVPLRCSGTSLGVVTGTLRDPAVITPGSVSLWCRLADQTALALRYADAIGKARVAGTDRERRRINEELHDTVGQDLFALKMLAARAEVVAQRAGAPDVAGLVSELRVLADQVDSGVRALIGERRRVGQALPLSEQLSGLAKEVGARSGVDIEARVGGEWDHLSSECGETVIRIVQEALHNIEKHAHARTATLSLAADPDGMLLIEVSDDGARLDPDAVSSASFGLTFIRERAAGYGGSVAVSTDPRTTLRVRLRPDYQSEWDAISHS